MKGVELRYEECVTVNGKPLDRTVSTTDVHLRGIPVIVPVKRRVIASKRGKAARRRPNSRVQVSNPFHV